VTEVVVWGVGELGGAFAHGWLRRGATVHGLPRGRDPEALARAVPGPDLVLVAVGEADLPPVFEAMPDAWRDRVALLQNELLPAGWASLRATPSVAIVWFEKKRTKPITVIQPTVLAGPRAGVLAEALDGLGVPHVSAVDLAFELVRKNLYILSANLGGLATGAPTVGALLEEDSFEALVEEVLTLQAALLGAPLDRPRLRAALREDFLADSGHGARGRSAPARLSRALAQAAERGLPLPALEALAPAG
jgi:ketopantoate reductase